MDNANPPMSVCLRLRSRPGGKPTGPLTKSSVKFCEWKERRQFVSAQTTTRLLRRFYLNLWIFLLHYFEIKDVYIRKQVKQRVTRLLLL
ncbi:hypothetical protein LDENG_00207750 [Lucifuga dentata]|nr:hypothetical protein LDENG_00207750 [Lucifuga dentata]